MQYKDFCKLFNLIAYAPEEKQNEYSQLLISASKDTSTKRKLAKDMNISERGKIKFTTKELSKMEEHIRKLFIIDNKVVNYRVIRGMYQARYHRDGFDIEVASKYFNEMKSKFIAKLNEQQYNKPNKLPFMKDFVYEWLELKKPTLKESTFKRDFFPFTLITLQKGKL